MFPYQQASAPPSYQQGGYQQTPHQQPAMYQQQAPPQYGQPYQAAPPPQQQPPQYIQPQPYTVAPQQTSPTKTDHMRVPLTAIPPERFEATRCRDVLWAIVFIVQLIIIFAVSFYYYNSGSEKVISGNSSSGFVNKNFWGLAMLVFLTGLLCAVTWLYLMRKFAKSLIYWALYLNLAVWTLMGLVGFISGAIVWGFVCLLYAGFLALWMWCVKDRIAFASAMINIAVEALLTMPSNFILPPLSAVLQVVWSLIWVMGLSFVVYDGQSTNKPNNFVIFLFVLSFYWTSQVIANVVLVTIMGSVATWYFKYPDEQPGSAVFSSFKRAVTTSFGSICFGSFIVAFLQALRFMVQSARNQDHPIARACVDCILGCLEDIMNYFNMYAYAQVAIYGKTYCDAAKDTWSLFVSKGFDVVINDDLVHMVFWLTSTVSAAVTGTIALLAARYMFHVPQFALWGMIGLMVGFVLTLCVTIVIGAGVKCLFVCFAEDPAILSEKKPGVYTQLELAWKARFGKLPARLVGAA